MNSSCSIATPSSPTSQLKPPIVLRAGFAASNFNTVHERVAALSPRLHLAFQFNRDRLSPLLSSSLRLKLERNASVSRVHDKSRCHPVPVPSVQFMSNSNNPRTADVRPAASRRAIAALSLSMTDPGGDGLYVPGALTRTAAWPTYAFRVPCCMPHVIN
jgi:hypothetical protein